MLNNLRDVATYSNERISLNEITLETYVTTDNLLQNKQGKVKAEKLPPQAGNVTQFCSGDILIANIRPYLKKIWLAKYSGGSSADVLTLKVRKGFDSSFVFYSLFRDDFFGHMMNGSKGTKMPRGDKNQILDFPIPHFTKSTQKHIAKVLSDLDTKIELNNKINAELEAMAKLIYDYWFVQFDFPDDNGKPYKSSGGKMIYNHELNREIPERWKVKELSTFANITTGKLDSNAEVLGGKYLFYTCASDPTTINSYEFDDSVILIAGNNASGNFHINRYSGKFNAYQRTYIITAKKEKYLDYLFQVLSFQMKILKTRGKGSQTKFLTIGMLTDIHVFETNSETMFEFNKIANPLYNKQMNIKYENENLSKLRDWLLPMLMNGQVTVGEANRIPT